MYASLVAKVSVVQAVVWMVVVQVALCTTSSVGSSVGGSGSPPHLVSCDNLWGETHI